MQVAYKSPLGLEVCKGDWEGAEWTITGNIKGKYQPRTFQSAYDFEEWVQRNIRCTNIIFDSEYCQFFAYAMTKRRAVGFLKAIEKKIGKIVG